MARAAARIIPLDWRLTAFLAAALAALLLLAVLATMKVPPTVGVPLVLLGFLAAQAAAVGLLSRPPDHLLRAEREELTASLPEAKRRWNEDRQRRQAARAMARARPVVESLPAPQTAAVPPTPPPNDSSGSPPVLDLVPAVDPLPRDWLHGDGTFSLPVVGASYHQRALAELSTAEDRVVPAVLRLEDNPYDRYAVTVWIAGRKVGHLTRPDARAFRLRVAGDGRIGPEFPCVAAIRVPHGSGEYRVQLDVCLYR
jgi:hypothetical protein